MKKIFLIALLLVTASICYSQDKSEKQPFAVKNFANEKFSMAEVETSGGSISVTAVNNGEVRVEVYVSYPDSKTRLSKEEIENRLAEKYNLDISVANNKLTASAKPKNKIFDWKESLSISFKLFVPKNTETRLSTSGGSVKLDGVSGNQDFRTSGGSLTVDNVTGNIKGKTSGGSIKVHNASNNIDLSTSGGSVEAKNCNGKITLHTSGGTLSLYDLNGEIEAKTSGGSISGSNIKGELKTSTSGGSINLSDLSCSLEATTNGGSMNTSFVELGKYINLKNSAGNITIEFPKDKGMDLDLSGMRIRTSNLKNFSGTNNDDEIEGKINGGGIPVKAKAGSGTISVDFK